ncbi:MAG TPA: hypothetical protein VD863_15660, partial [Bradyrhizobium sp.]|nr:hypothetical protein [Bradyrhizobium sp.]
MELYIVAAGWPRRARKRRAIWFRNIAVGRRISMSAVKAASMANALSQPNRRNDGKSENTV